MLQAHNRSKEFRGLEDEIAETRLVRLLPWDRIVSRGLESSKARSLHGQDHRQECHPFACRSWHNQALDPWPDSWQLPVVNVRQSPSWTPKSRARCHVWNRGRPACPQQIGVFPAMLDEVTVGSLVFDSDQRCIFDQDQICCLVYRQPAVTGRGRKPEHIFVN